MNVMNVREADFRVFARQAGVVVPYPVGAAIFAEGDAPRHMYVLLSGSVEVRSHGRVIEVIQAGDGLGILSLLDGQPRTATATVVTPAEVAVIDERTFRFMIEETPGFVWYVLDELAQRLRATNAALG